MAKIIGTVGDVNPVDYGGGLVVEIEEAPKSRVQVIYFELVSDEDDSPVLLYRYDTDRLAPNGRGGLYTARVMEMNPKSLPKPRYEYNEWFTKYLPGIDKACGEPVGTMASWFCSEDPLVRARAYTEIGVTQGFDNLDHYPVELSYEEAERYVRRLKGESKWLIKGEIRPEDGEQLYWSQDYGWSIRDDATRYFEDEANTKSVTLPDQTGIEEW